MRRAIALALLAGALFAPGEARAVEPEPTSTEPAEGEVTVTNDEQDVQGLSYGQCRTVDVARIGRDIFGLVVYKFHQRKRWCWDYPYITWKGVTTYVSDVDPNMEYRGVVAANGYFYTWCCSVSRSGHYSLRQGKFENCILWFPCTRTEYPWVKIWVRANGTFRYATGL